MTCRSDRPLFIPLKGEWYDKFSSGKKTVEYRRHGPGWNLKTCWVGRPVVLSRGYGKAHRMTGRITRIRFVTSGDAETIYGPGVEMIAIQISLSRRLTRATMKR